MNIIVSRQSAHIIMSWINVLYRNTNSALHFIMFHMYSTVSSAVIKFADIIISINPIPVPLFIAVGVGSRTKHHKLYASGLSHKSTPAWVITWSKRLRAGEPAQPIAWEQTISAISRSTWCVFVNICKWVQSIKRWFHYLPTFMYTCRFHQH